MKEIEGHLAFYPNRVDKIDVDAGVTLPPFVIGRACAPQVGSTPDLRHRALLDGLSEGESRHPRSL